MAAKWVALMLLVPEFKVKSRFGDEGSSVSGSSSIQNDIRSELFCNITQRRMTILYRCFGTTYWSYLQGTSWPLKMGPIRWVGTSVKRSNVAASLKIYKAMNHIVRH